jgi:hypothetical protein
MLNISAKSDDLVESAKEEITNALRAAIKPRKKPTTFRYAPG